MWKIGTELKLKNGQNNWSLESHTVIIKRYDGKFLYCSRKGGSNGTYPYFIEDLEDISWNPIIRIKRMLCRAFERPYK